MESLNLRIRSLEVEIKNFRDSKVSLLLLFTDSIYLSRLDPKLGRRIETANTKVHFEKFSYKVKKKMTKVAKFSNRISSFSRFISELIT